MNTPNNKEYTDSVIRNGIKESQLSKVQYFSKWQHTWRNFEPIQATLGDIIAMENMHYHLRVNSL